jgi:hypothetical protein
MQQKPMKALITLAACAIFALCASTQAQAQDKKADPTGTWSWTRPGRNGGADTTNTLALKVEGDKLTGTLTAPGRGGAAPTDTAIEDGTVKDGAISFSVTREYNGNKMVAKYSGKVSGDTIEGKMETTRNGTPRTADWKATRQPKM